MALYTWTEGMKVLRYSDHHDKRPREHTVARVLKTQVVLDNGERYSARWGLRWGQSDMWFRARIEPKEKQR